MTAKARRTTICLDAETAADLAAYDAAHPYAPVNVSAICQDAIRQFLRWEQQRKVRAS